MLMTALPPRPHQVSARDDIVERLKTEDRALFVSACGTGKTKALQYIISQRRDNLIVAFFPSLQLVDQTVADWRVQYEGRWEQPVVVCSDDSVGKVADGESIDDLRTQGAFVTSNASELAQRLREHAGSGSELPLVVFATYHSSDKVAAAQEQCDVWFDIAILDEAHRATADNFMGRLVLDEHSVLARKRLSATATPRVFHLRKKATEIADALDMYSEQGTAAYGPIAHDYGLREAIDDGVLVDYRIHILELSRVDVADAIGDVNPDDLDPSDPDVRMAMGVVALERAQTELGIERTIAYLSSRARARTFVATAQLLGVQNNAAVITGDMPTSARKPLLESLANDGGLLANVKCLTEGVDIPRLDAVLFVDPRSNKVDIVQAVGRAVRRHDASGKKFGHVILPVLEAPSGIDEEWLDNTAFGKTWDVLTQMAMNDTTLHTQLRDDARAATQVNDVEDAVGAGKDPGALVGAGEGPDELVGTDEAIDVELDSEPTDDLTREHEDQGVRDEPEPSDDNVLVIHPAHASRDIDALVDKLRSRVSLHTVRLIDVNYDWERKADEVGAFHIEHGRWPSQKAQDPHEHRLGQWLSGQRQARKNGDNGWSPERAAYLNCVMPGWGESQADKWTSTADEVGAFYVEHRRWPSRAAKYPHERRLGQWLSHQRKARTNGKKGWPPEREAYLDRVMPGWSESQADKWTSTADEVATFEAEHGRWPMRAAKDPHERRLGAWLSAQRQARKNGNNGWTSEREAYLDRVALGWAR